jgi:hypothetical protein
MLGREGRSYLTEEAVLVRPLIVHAAVSGRRHGPAVVSADLEGRGAGTAAQCSAVEGEQQKHESRMRHLSPTTAS